MFALQALILSEERPDAMTTSQTPRPNMPEALGAMPADVLFPADTEMGRRCREFDWAGSPFGAVASWPQSLRTAVAMVLRQGLPQALCWGSELRQIYNDGYRVVLGDKHPGALGLPVLESWSEIAPEIEPLFTRVLGGETVSFTDLHLRVNRHGGKEDAYFTFSYSPVLVESGEVCGVLVNCVDTTDIVAGRGAQLERNRLLDALEQERARLASVFRQSPSFIAILRGPDNAFEMINEAYEQMIGHGRNVIGRPLLEALPEARGQAFVAHVARVRETGESVVVRDLEVVVERSAGAPLETRFIDITYLPLVEPDGSRSAVIAHGSDVTQQVQARRAVERLLAQSEHERVEAEAARARMTEANALLQDQQRELELINQQLQDNAAELEALTEELQASAVHLEQRTAEAEAARQTVSAIVEAITDGFVAFDRDLCYTYVNGRAAEMWGRTADELLGRNPDDVWSQSATSTFVNTLRRVLITRRAEVVDGYATSLRVPIEMRAYPSADGGLVVFFADLTERRRAEESAAFLSEVSKVLASSGDYQTTLMTLAAAAVPRLGDWCAVDILADPDRGVWPPKMERVAVVHQDPTKITLAQTLTTRFPVDWTRDTGTPGVIRTRRPMFVADVTDAMLVAGAQNAEHAELLRELHIRSIIIVPLIARDRVLGAITLVMAESERHFTDADLALAVDLGQRAGVALDNARLLRDTAEANTAKTEFLRTISHELRQPLNAIKGYIDLWKMGLRGEIAPAMRDDVERLARNQEHLGALIEDLLSFTRLDAGRLTVERVPVSVAAVFEALDAMMRPQMLAHRLEFSHDPCDRVLTVLGDRERIIQVCLNLLTNAMRATPPGGRVVLSCSPDADSVTIEVTDTGVGIPEDKLDAIFAPFTQLGRSLSAPKEGAGLGLAISRGLAAAMGGTLAVRSVPGDGSTFSFRLPRSTS